MNSIFKHFAFLIIAFMTVNGQVDRSKAPLPGPAPAINISEYQSFELENGLKVFVVENHKLPVISIRLTVNNDPVLEGKNAGCANATGIMLRTGTKTRTKDQIDSEIDQIGASLSTSENGLFASSLKKHVEKLFAISSDIIINAEFRGAELEKTKQLMISEYAQGKEDPNEIAGRITRKIFFGAGHPYGQSFTEESINNITLEMCSNYHAAYFRPNISYLAIIGDITLKEAKSLAAQYFNGWQKKEVPKLSYNNPEPPAGRKVSVIDRPGAVQSVIRIGHPVKLSVGAPDEISARVANTILGGGVFRLFDNLRQKHGYTYGAYSSLQSDELIGSFTASASVRNSVTDSAVAEFMFELKRMSAEPVSDEELTKVKNYLTGGFAISLESPQTVADFAINTARYNLPADYYKNYLKNLASVTKQDVQTAAAKYILPEHSHIVVVGKASDIAEKLKRFSSDNAIDYFDADGNKIDITAKSAPAEVTAEQVIEKYINAIGGRDAIMKVKDRTTVTTTRAMGMDVKTAVFQKFPNKYLSKTQLGKMGDLTTLFDGKQGSITSPMGVQELKDTALVDQAFISDMTAILRLKQLGVALKLFSVEKINNADAYKIELQVPKGHSIIQYYNAETGYKVKEERVTVTLMGTFTQFLEFSDYRKVGDMFYPFSTKLTASGRTVEMKTEKIEVNTNLDDLIFQ